MYSVDAARGWATVHESFNPGEAAPTAAEVVAFPSHKRHCSPLQFGRVPAI